MGYNQDEADDRCTEAGDDQAFYAQPDSMTDQTQTTTAPVAWRRKTASDVYWTLFDSAEDVAFYTSGDRVLRYEVQPLYTTPQPLAIGLDREAVASPVTHLLDFLTANDGASGVVIDCDDVKPIADEIRSLLAVAAPAEGWQGIETAPKDGTILLWDAARNVAVSGRWHVEPTLDTPSAYEPGWAFWTTDDDLIVWDGGEWDKPTHWMPLPAAPTGDTGA